MTPEYDLALVAGSLGHSFHDLTLLRDALTHRSFANEQPAQAPRDNERLEFLGDAVLSLSVSARFQSSSPVLGERATRMPRATPSTRASGAAMMTSASPSPERSGTGMTQWPKSPSGHSPSHSRIGAPLAPDHTVTFPFC